MDTCDCLNRCGDDSRVAKGTVRPCATWLNWSARARIIAARRDHGDSNAIVVIFDREPSDNDLRALQCFDRWPSP